MSFLEDIAESADLPNDTTYASVWDHVEELRNTLISVFCVIVAGIALCLYFYTPLSQLLLFPLKSNNPLQSYEVKHQQIVNYSEQTGVYTLPNHANIAKKSKEILETSPSTFSMPPNSSLEIFYTEIPHSLALLSPLEGMITTLKICFWGGLTATSPFWIYFIFRFIAPAINRAYWWLFLPFLGLSFIFAGVGFFFAYFITLPLANEMLLTFNTEIGINLWSYSSYIDYTLLLLLANVLAFELMLILFLLVHFGILEASFMKMQRRPVILLAFIIAALLTPPDVLTQLLLAIPLIGLYELAICYAKIKKS